mgnify:CR=1 FL=1
MSFKIHPTSACALKLAQIEIQTETSDKVAKFLTTIGYLNQALAINPKNAEAILTKGISEKISELKGQTPFFRSVQSSVQKLNPK